MSVRILKALLPEVGSDIKGNMKSQAELRVDSGYADSESELAEVLEILDREVRLITPTEKEFLGLKDSNSDTKN